MGRKRKGPKREYTEEETLCWLAGKKTADTSAQPLAAAPPEAAAKPDKKRPEKRSRKEKKKLAAAAAEDTSKDRSNGLGISFLNDESAANCPAPVSSWSDPSLPSQIGECMELVRGKQGEHITGPTPVQAQFWPAALAGLDVLALSLTGSGKTLAYLLPMLPMFDGRVGVEGGRPVGLVLAPTRELVVQVARECKYLERLCNARSVAVYGGQSVGIQLSKLALGVEVVVAAPGRLTELIEQSQIDLSQVRYLVLDEADKMMQAGWELQLNSISAAIPRPRQTILVSATLPEALSEKASEWMNDTAIHFRASGGDAETSADQSIAIPSNITQSVQVSAEHKKVRKLLKWLSTVNQNDKANDERSKSRVMIFCNRIKAVKFVHRMLSEQFDKGIGLLHGQMNQEERDSAVAAFRCGQVQLLACTDVAARGLHVNKLPFVVNWDFPGNLEVYAHRVGRAGRGGASGHALTFFTRNFKKCASSLVQLLQQTGQQVDHHLVRLAEEEASDEEEEDDAGTDEEIEMDLDAHADDSATAEVVTNESKGDDANVEQSDSDSEEDAAVASKKNKKAKVGLADVIKQRRAEVTAKKGSDDGDDEWWKEFQAPDDAAEGAATNEGNVDANVEQSDSDSEEDAAVASKKKKKKAKVGLADVIKQRRAEVAAKKGDASGDDGDDEWWKEFQAP